MSEARGKSRRVYVAVAAALLACGGAVSLAVVHRAPPRPEDDARRKELEARMERVQHDIEALQLELSKQGAPPAGASAGPRDPAAPPASGAPAAPPAPARPAGE